MNVKEFIDEIRKKPEMYVDEIKLDYIYYLLFGFVIPYRPEEPIIDIEFRRGFYERVEKWAQNIDVEYGFVSLHWFYIIQKYTSSENEAVEVFYKLSDEFFAEVKLPMSHDG